MCAKQYDFQSKVVEKKPCAITIEVEIAPAQTDVELANVYQSIQQSAKVAGFRVGKVPMDIIKKDYSDVAKEKLIENMIKKTVFSALEKENFAPIDMPVINNIDYDFGKPLKYTFKAECQPEVTIKDYKEIKVKKEKYKVTDKNIDENINNLLDRNAKLVVSKDEVVKKDSFVVVSYEGFCDGKALENIKAKEHMLDLGSDQTLKGFKDGLKGLKKGESKDIEIEYPKDYPNKTLAEKKVVFKTTVNEIKEKELPVLNDDFAKDMGLENLDELKKRIKESLEQEELRRQKNEEEKQIVESLLDKNKFDVPETIVANQKQYLIKRMSDYMKRQGVSDDFIAKQVESSDAKYAEEAEKNVRLSYILNGIYTQEKLEVTEADLLADKQKMLDSNPTRKDDVEKYFNENKENISAALKEEKIFKFLVDNAKITETEKDMPVNKK
jgi:trigger factor